MNEPIIELDVHGMTLYQAQIAIDAALRRAGSIYRLRVIHGYRGGTGAAKRHGNGNAATGHNGAAP